MRRPLEPPALLLAVAALSAATFCASGFVITPHTDTRTATSTSTKRRRDEVKIASRSGAVAISFNDNHRLDSRPMEARRGSTSRDDNSDESCGYYFWSAPLFVALALFVSVIGCCPPYSLAVGSERMESGGGDAAVVFISSDNNALDLRAAGVDTDIDCPSLTTATDTIQMFVADDVAADEELEKLSKELAALNAEIARIDEELASTENSGDSSGDANKVKYDDTTSLPVPPSTPFMEHSDKIDNSLDETALAIGKPKDQANSDNANDKKSNEIESKASVVEEEQQAAPESPKVKSFDYQKAADELFADDGSTTWFSAGVSKGKGPSSYNKPSEPDPVIEGLGFKLFDSRNAPTP